MIGKIILIALVITFTPLIYGGYYNWQVDLAYQRDVGVYFNYADRASDAVTKSMYFNQYIEALEKHDIISGCPSLYFCEQPNAKLEDNYKVAKSLQKRLIEIAKLDEKETAYQLGMTQMTENEFCWFPHQTFNQKYLLDHGAWGEAVTPYGTRNSCE